MYQVSNDTINLIESRSRKIEWEGTITLTDGAQVAFTRRNISEGTGSLNLSCAPASAATWGNAYLGELVLSFKNLNVDRTKLQNAVIGLSFRVIGTSSITWGEAASNTWDELSAYTWGNLVLSKTIPMGIFIVSEAMRDYGSVKIRAYDNMRKFDKSIPAIDTQARTPYQWLSLACSTCGVVFGMTYAQVFSLPNGRRLVKFTNSDSSIKTWRDIVAAIAAMIGGNAIMSRSGELIIRPYNDIVVDVISPGKRYSSSFSDYESYYTGLRLSYAETGIQEYATNADRSEDDTGLVYDLGKNPFMQINDGTARAAVMQELIDRQSGLRYTPYRMTGPLNPLYDLMDTLILTGNHAEDSIAPITSITYRIGGEMSLSCGGENPALMTAESKESKALDGMSSSSNYGEDLWMLMGNAPAAQITIEANTETLVGEILLYAKEINSMIQISYTAAYNLAKTALVTVRLAVDEDTVYTVEQNQFIGTNKITATTGYQFHGTGSHAVRAYLTVSEATIDIGGGGVLMSLDVTENGLYTAADKGVYGFSQVTATVDDAMGFYAQATAVDVPASPASVIGDVLDDLSFGTVTGMSLPPTYDVSQGFLEYINPHLSDFHIILANWAYQLTDKFEFVYRMVSNPNTMGNWPSILGTSQSTSAEMFLQYNFWGGRTVMNIAYHGSWAGDGNMSYETPYDYENYYKIAADGGTFTLYKGPSRDNISTVCFQKVFPTGAVPIDTMATLFPLHEGRLDMEFYRLKVWDENDQLLHDYRPIPDGICDAVTHYKFMATTTGHINGPPAN